MVAAFDPMFMIGSMDLIAGEKVARAFLLAAKNKLPVITFSASDGTRMQERVGSLMQMVKTSAVIYKHANKNYYIFLLYVLYVILH